MDKIDRQIVELLKNDARRGAGYLQPGDFAAHSGGRTAGVVWLLRGGR